MVWKCYYGCRSLIRFKLNCEPPFSHSSWPEGLRPRPKVRQLYLHKVWLCMQCVPFTDELYIYDFILYITHVIFYAHVIFIVGTMASIGFAFAIKISTRIILPDHFNCEYEISFLDTKIILLVNIIIPKHTYLQFITKVTVWCWKLTLTVNNGFVLWVKHIYYNLWVDSWVLKSVYIIRS